MATNNASGTAVSATLYQDTADSPALTFVALNAKIDALPKFPEAAPKKTAKINPTPLAWPNDLPKSFLHHLLWQRYGSITLAHQS